MLTNLETKQKTTIIKKACPYCGALASVKSKTTFNLKVKSLLECGHTLIEILEDKAKPWTVKSLSGKEPFPYQYKTLDFTVDSNFRTGIFHEQGVGKTICSLIAVAKYPEKLMPFAVICKSSLKVQWWKEILDWTGQPAQVISNGSDKAFPGLFKAYVISYDLLKSKDFFSDLNLKLVILDECQQIKNGQAKRTKALREAIKDIPHVIALSGTPIKNHAGEYFPVLNILDPITFHSQAAFERDYCDTYSSGYGYKVGGLNRFRTDEFKKITDQFIIRYERNEVLPDLPKIFRKNYFVELGEEVEQAYKKAYLDFKEEYENAEDNGTKFEEQGNLLAKLNRLRHLTGIAKVLPVTDFVEEFLKETDKKICLFVHHKDVGLGLYNNISNVCRRQGIKMPVSLTSENAGTDVGMRIDEIWKSDPSIRVMIASTLSAGEGKNWQMCSDAIIVERQWNPANEEQAEGRFPRPGATAESISVTYALALGTPDEYLAEIVERKREICKKTMGSESVIWNQSSVIKELSEILISKGGKRWNL
jgi:SNF2 family DNA or RNA helicase